MKKFLKLESDKMVLKVSKNGLPECFVYSDNYFPAPDYVGSVNKVLTVISNQLQEMLMKMKDSNKRAVKISFEFSDFAEDFYDTKRYEEKELELFG